MTPAEFRAAEASLGGLLACETADLLGCSVRSVVAYRNGHTPVPKARAMLLRGAVAALTSARRQQALTPGR